MPRIIDLTCDNKHVMLDVIVRNLNDDNPPCPTCGLPTYGYWANTKSTFEAQVWNPLTISVAGKPTTFETKQAFEDKVAQMRKKGGVDWDVQFPTKNFVRNYEEKIYEQKKARRRENAEQS